MCIRDRFVFVRLQNRFGSNDYDPRNFTRSKRGTYGTSGWMSEKEMRSVLEVAGPERAKGIILGQPERGSVICLPEDTRLNKHIAAFGASGTMKSRGVIRPALFQSIRRGESVVVADPKSEMFADTAELFKKHGYKVRVYNLDVYKRQEMETVEYVICTIHPFDQSVILDAFGVDVDATYDQFSITYGEAILNMSNALKMTMYGTASDGSVPPISDAELNLFLASLDCSGKRKELMLSLIHI